MSSLLFKAAAASTGVLGPSLTLSSALYFGGEDVNSRITTTSEEIQDQTANEECEEIEGFKLLIANISEENKGLSSVCAWIPLEKDDQQNLSTTVAQTQTLNVDKNEVVLIAQETQSSNCQIESGQGQYYGDSSRVEVTVCFDNKLKTPKTPTKDVNPPTKEDRWARVPTFWEILYELWKAFTSTDRLRAF